MQLRGVSWDARGEHYRNGMRQHGKHILGYTSVVALDIQTNVGRQGGSAIAHDGRRGRSPTSRVAQRLNDVCTPSRRGERDHDVVRPQMRPQLTGKERQHRLVVGHGAERARFGQRESADRRTAAAGKVVG